MKLNRRSFFARLTGFAAALVGARKAKALAGEGKVDLFSSQHVYERHIGGKTAYAINLMKARAAAELGFRGLMFTSDPKWLMGQFATDRDFVVRFTHGGFEAIHRNGSTITVSRPTLDEGKEFTSLHVESSPFVMSALSQEALQRYAAQARSQRDWLKYS